MIVDFTKLNNLSSLRLFTGAALRKLEEEKGVVVRFVIGRRSFFHKKSELEISFETVCPTNYTLNCSPNRGDSLDRAIDDENKHTNDFFVLVCLTAP